MEWIYNYFVVRNMYFFYYYEMCRFKSLMLMYNDDIKNLKSSYYFKMIRSYMLV